MSRPPYEEPYIYGPYIYGRKAYSKISQKNPTKSPIDYGKA